jgi:hypothetical protein
MPVLLSLPFRRRSKITPGRDSQAAPLPGELSRHIGVSSGSMYGSGTGQGMAMKCRNSVKWKYRSENNFSWESGLDIAEDRFFLDDSGTVRLIIEAGGLITVTGGYSWNGCSPKFCLFDLLIGTPDGVVHVDTGRPKTYFASMIHDALYQFLRVNSPVSRGMADRCFLHLMAESEFSLRYLYWFAVRAFGWLFWRATKAKRQWQGSGEKLEAFTDDARSPAAE